MGFFKGKEKKNKEAINASKQQILMMIQTAQLSCKDPNAATVLRNISSELQSQGETSEEKVLAIDFEVKQLLAEANSFMLKNQYPTAITKLNKAYNRAVDRHQYCFAGGQMTKEDAARARQTQRMMDKIAQETQKTRAEELQSQIDEKNAELDALNAEFENLRQLYQRNPANAAIMAQATSVKAKIAATKSTINNLTSELNIEMSNDLVAQMAKDNEQLVKGRTHTESEMEVARSALMSQNDEIKKTQAQAEANFDLLGQGAQGFFNPFEDSVGMTAGAGMANPFGDMMATPGATQQSRQYGTFDAAAVGTVDMARDIAKTARALQESIEAYTDKIDDANDELNDFNAELRPLLERRRNASPSDCLVLDGQIDQLNAKRSSVIYRIKRYRQVVSQLNDKMSLLDKLNTQQDLASTNLRIEQLTGGKFSDFEGLAMFLNDSVKQSNEQLEEIGTAVSVADSEEILMNSASGVSAALSDAATTKDEDKYNALMGELGMPIVTH
jgi:hypothetical protein